MHWGTSFFSTALPRRWAQSLFGLAHSLLVWLAERQCVSAWKGLEGLLVSSPAHSLSRRRDGSNQCCECFDTHSLQIGCWHLHTSENLLNLPTSARLRATERTEISHLREWPDRAPAEAPTARCQRAEDALSNPSRLWIMKFKQLQHWLCENLPRFSAVTFFTLQKRTQRFPESEWQDLFLQLPNYRVDSEIIITRNPEDITEQISLRMYWLLLCVTLTGLSVARAETGELGIVVCCVGSARVLCSQESSDMFITVICYWCSPVGLLFQKVNK